MKCTVNEHTYCIKNTKCIMNNYKEKVENLETVTNTIKGEFGNIKAIVAGTAEQYTEIVDTVEGIRDFTKNEMKSMLSKMIELQNSINKLQEDKDQSSVNTLALIEAKNPFDIFEPTDKKLSIAIPLSASAKSSSTSKKEATGHQFDPVNLGNS
mmetsp:Transcript_7249/g.10384  ORF Transcript_7249/g.10384 Transcript_7249/m.10384 type:complete len:154 (-) Transcript_7249:791-1252(-)